MNSYVQPACICPTFSYAAPSLNTVIGWGLIEENDYLKTFGPVCPFLGQLESTVCIDTMVCHKDRGAVMHYWPEDTKNLFIVGFIDCTEPASWGKEEDIGDRIIHLLDHEQWIVHVTKLDYLRLVRKGKPYDPLKQYPNLLPRRNCGNIVIPKNDTTSNAQLNEFPWMAIIFKNEVNSGTMSPFCLGTLISHRYVLTAAFCGLHADPLGDFDRDKDPDCAEDDETDCAPPFKDYDVDHLIRHPDFDFEEDINYMSNNIALIRTKRSILYEDHIQPICLPMSQELRRKTLPQYIITGWNVLASDEPVLLKEVEQNLVNITKCGDRFLNNTNFDAITCSIKDDFYSPGLPLVNAVDFKGTRYVQFGLMSIRKRGSFYYTLISHYMDWIIANMEE